MQKKAAHLYGVYRLFKILFAAMLIACFFTFIVMLIAGSAVAVVAAADDTAAISEGNTADTARKAVDRAEDSNAVDVETAKISLFVINPPPVMGVVKIIPSEGDYINTLSSMRCISSIYDNNPVHLSLHYKWFVNGNIVFEGVDQDANVLEPSELRNAQAKNALSSGLSENDIVVCEATPHDGSQFGYGKNASVLVENAPLILITGHAIERVFIASQKNVQNNIIPILIAVCVMLVVLNVVLFVVLRRKSRGIIAKQECSTKIC